MSTTLFNAAFFAGLEILERKNHSIYIEHYPKGRDATVSAGSPNLRFRNDTKHYILVRGASDGIKTKFVIYGTDDGRQVELHHQRLLRHRRSRRSTRSTTRLWPPAGPIILEKGQQGKKIKVVRVVTASDGSVIHKDTFVSVYPMIPQEIEVGTGRKHHYHQDDHHYHQGDHHDHDHRGDDHHDHRGRVVGGRREAQAVGTGAALPDTVMRIEKGRAPRRRPARSFSYGCAAAGPYRMMSPRLTDLYSLTSIAFGS